MLLQVQRVSTVILLTETRWESAFEKSKNAIQMQIRVQVRTRKMSSMANSMGELAAPLPDTENASKQQSNDAPCTVTHSGLLSKKTH